MSGKTRVFALFLAPALPVIANDLTLAIDNIMDSGGVIYWSVYDSAEHYDAGDAPLASGRNRAAGDALRITLHDLPRGSYAARIFHDTNGNGELDRNMLGIPTEPYGFSNDAGGRGPASFDDAAIAVDGETNMTIRMR